MIDIKTVINRFGGDVRLWPGPDGVTAKFINGQPIMDQGFENYVIIKLFTRMGWVGNHFIRNTKQKFGSRFEKAHDQPINLRALRDIEKAGEQALEVMIEDGLASKITVTASNPASNRIDTLVQIANPGQDLFQLLITKNGINWIAQIVDPANERWQYGV
jgi:phage gp46-like protein